MKELLIENFRIDTDRCTVHRDTDSISLEPKVVQVLLLLAKYQGEVVSHQTLLNEVWPDTIVDPSALQRCIAQLRKAFLDNAKEQKVIATFPKKGYSLIAEVRQVTDRKVTGTKVLNPAAGIAASVMALIIAVIYISGQQHIGQDMKTAPADDTLIPGTGNSQNLMTEYEPGFYAVYSPDGRFVVYPRFTGSELSNLWIRDLSTDQDFLLTENEGLYEYATWSPDSNQIAYVESRCQDQQCRNITCSSLNSLSLTSGNAGFHRKHNLINCKPVRLQSPQWLSTNDIALIELDGRYSSIIKYKIDESHSENLFRQSGKVLNHLRYSINANKLAATLYNETGKEILLISVATGEYNLLPIDLPEFMLDKPWYPEWNHQSDGILISSVSGIFNIGLDGKVTKQRFPFLPAVN